MKSPAMAGLSASLDIVAALLELERSYRDPPLPQDSAIVEGLRAGSAVLVVAAFEEFLKTVFREEISRLQATQPKFSALPPKVRVEAVYKQLEMAMKTPGGTKEQRIPEIRLAAGRVFKGELYPEAFSSTQSNPSPETVERMFKDIAFDAVFAKVKYRFERLWRRPVAATFVRDKLEEIVQRRHQVAHSGRALNVSRVALAESVRFTRVLSATLEAELRLHLRAVAKAAK